MKKIIGIGNSLTDILVRIPDDRLLAMLGYGKGSMNLISESKMREIEDSIRNESKEIRSGGSAANTIHALATLGIPCAYIGKTGDDETGLHFKAQLNDAGVTMMDVENGTAPSGRCYVMITPDGERTFATYLGSALELDAQDLKPEYFEGYDLLHIEGYLLQNRKLIRRAMEIAKMKSLTVSLDLASYNVVLANLEEIRNICMEHVHILFANEEEGKAFSGEESDELILEQMAGNCTVSILKLGPRGARLKQQEKVTRFPAIPTKVLDTTGAGDIFAAGFLAGYANDRDMKISLSWGTELASEIIQVLGARLFKETILHYKTRWGI